MPPFRIQFVGNLFVDHSHEHFSKFVRPNHSPTLALLGNIGSPFRQRTHEFLDYCSQHWDRVFWIAGPHELGRLPDVPLGTTFRDNMERMEEKCSKWKNLSILNQSGITVDGIQILGTTLWTPIHPYRVEDKYNQPEFSFIRKATGGISPIDLSDWHAEDVEFLKNKLDTSRPTIVLTHHLPHLSLLSPTLSMRTWKRNGLETCNLPSLLKDPCKLWLSGASGGSAIGLFSHQTFAMVNSLYEFPNMSNRPKNPYFNPELYAELDRMPPFHYSVAHGVPPQQKFSEIR
jgi:hypothetical protein